MKNNILDKFSNLKKINEFIVRYKILVILCFLICFVGIVIIPRAFAQPQPVRSVEIFSENADYNKKEPGSWKVTKSAKWVEKGVAEITFDVDSVFVPSDEALDILFVIDTSDYMAGGKLDNIKVSLKNVMEKVLSNQGNRIGLISFGSTSNIESDITNDKELLINKVEQFSGNGLRSYYDALLDVDKVLKKSQNDSNRQCVVAFLVGGGPTKDIPNENIFYKIMKRQYSNVLFNVVQYTTKEIYGISDISDNQFLVGDEILEDVLYDATSISQVYEDFEISEFINSDFFKVKKENDIKSDNGNIIFDSSKQKINWMINNYNSGSKAKMIAKVSLKSEFINSGGLYMTNSNGDITSKIKDISENISSSSTPILTDVYNVEYDNNVPSDCNLNDNLDIRSAFVFDVIRLDKSPPTCSGYQFKGWKVVNKKIKIIGSNSFYMPEENIKIKAEWSKLSVLKKMKGDVYETDPAMLEKYTTTSTYGLHKYKSAITKVVFQNTLSNITGAIEVLDISENKTNEILAYIVPNQDNNSKYTAYIQAEGGVTANVDSGCLFHDFTSLVSIENFRYFDTSKATSMYRMFYNCSSLKSLDLSRFDTSNVTTIGSMFYLCSSLTSLDLKSFDTSNVKEMFNVFDKCTNIVTINVSSFDTSNVTTMGSMFNACRNLKNVDLSGFDTSKATDMHSMFQNCNNLTTTITISKILNSYSYMFSGTATSSGAKITVNYVSDVSSLISTYIGTKSSNSNVVKGELVIV